MTRNISWNHNKMVFSDSYVGATKTDALWHASPFPVASYS
jgi:hypothetical protein